MDLEGKPLFLVGNRRDLSKLELDDGLKSTLYLDGVVTVVDALHAHKQLLDVSDKKHNEAQKYSLVLFKKCTDETLI